MTGPGYGGTPISRAPKAATMLGFVRPTTNRRVVARPLAIRRVMEQLQAWLALPHVHIAHPSNTHFAKLRAELERLGTAGNLTAGAHLAVLAMERGYFIFVRYRF